MGSGQLSIHTYIHTNRNKISRSRLRRINEHCTTNYTINKQKHAKFKTQGRKQTKINIARVCNDVTASYTFKLQGYEFIATFTESCDKLKETDLPSKVPKLTH